MAGSGQLIPNGSMHWHIGHDGPHGRHDWRPHLGQGHAPHQTPLASHLTALHDGAFLYGIDPTQTGSIRVRLRFESDAEAKRALADALQKLSKAGELWEATVDIPVARPSPS